MRRVRDQGFVLVNALVLVAAMAAAAVYLLARAETGRAELNALQEADQVNAYLDAYEALAREILNRDALGGQIDYPGEAWADATRTVPLDRGTVRGEIADLQGRFNVNWLADPDDDVALAGFDTLLKSLGLSAQTGEAIVAFLSPGGPAARGPFARLDPPVDPLGGAVLSVSQLRGIPGVSDKDFARLAPSLSALAPDLPLNINTAPTEIIASFFPETRAAIVSAALARRASQPFQSVDTFLSEVELLREAALPEDFRRDRFAVSSNWFLATSTARLNDSAANRTAILFRQSLPFGATTIYRETHRP